MFGLVLLILHMISYKVYTCSDIISVWVAGWWFLIEHNNINCLYVPYIHLT